MQKKDIRNICIGCMLVVIFASSIGILLQLKSQKSDSDVKTKPTITWNIGSWLYHNTRGFEEYYNELLDKYGCSYHVKFQEMGREPDPMLAYDVSMGVVDAYVDSVFENADILTLNPESLCTDFYSYYAYKEKFCGLDEWLGTEVGQQLYKAYPEKAWESFRIDGKIQGVANLYNNRSAYLVLNMEYLDKYDICVEEQSWENWLDTIGRVWVLEKQSGKSDILGLFPEAFQTVKGATNINHFSGLIFVEEEDGLKIQPIFQNDDFLNTTKDLYERSLKGYIERDVVRVSQGKFIAAVIYSYCEDAAIGNMIEPYGCPEEIKLEAVHIAEWDLPFKGTGDKTVISAASTMPEAAFEVLALSYSVPELSNALAYGMEGVDYHIENGKVVGGLSSFVSDRFGNGLIIMPRQNEPIDREEKLREQFLREEDSKTLGFHVDIRDFEEEWGNVIEFYFNHESLYYGAVEDYEKALETMQETVKLLGQSVIVSEIEEQLIEWKEGADK